MNETSSRRPLFTCPLDFASSGVEETSGPPIAGRAELDHERLAIFPPAGPPLLFPLIEIRGIAAVERSIRLTLGGGDALTLSRLGARYDDCLLAFTPARNEALLDAFWMREEERAPATAAEHDTEAAARPCQLRLLETALVVLYPDADPVRLPYALITAVRAENHRLTLEVRWKGRWTFARMGRGYDPFVDALSAAMNALQVSHLDLVRRFLPGLDPAVLRNAGGLLRDGVAVPVEELEAVGLWNPLESALAATDAADEIAALKEMAAPAGMRAGLKRGLAGALSGDYLFLLVPLLAEASAAALETVRLDDADREAEGRATYVFRLDGPPGDALAALNRDLLDLNFRREPLLIPEADLPRRRPATLKTLRGGLLGRAVHRSPEGWKAEVLALARTAGKGNP